MLEQLGAEQLKALAHKAAAVRDVRDRMLRDIRDEALGAAPPARGEHNAAAELGLDVVPEGDPSRLALRDALASLSPAAMRELWAAVLIGRGDYGVKDWERALAEANRLTGVGPGLFMGLPDLHDHLAKVIYQLERR